MYLNNPKFSYQTLSRLKIIFERNVKNNQSFTLFGRTYVNDKWAAFSKSNIKVSLKQFFLGSLCAIFALLMAIHLVSGKETFYGTLISLLNTKVLLVSWNLFVEDVSARAFILASSIYTLFSRLISSELQKRIISSNLNNLKPNTVSRLSGTSTNRMRPKSLNLPLAPVLIHQLPPNPANFYKLLDSIRSFDQPSFVRPDEALNAAHLSHPYLPTLLALSSTRKTRPDDTNFLITDRDRKLADKIFLKLDRLLSLPETNLSSVNSGRHHLATLSIPDSINLGKQKRWLTKNSILTNSLTSEAYKLTESKKLLGLNLSMANISNKNIFFSARISSVKGTTPSKSNLANQLRNFNNTLFQPFTSLNHCAHTTHSWLLNPTINTLVSNETSAFFNHKKYYLNNGLVENNSVSSPSKGVSIATKYDTFSGLESSNTLAALLAILPQQATVLCFDESFSLSEWANVINIPQPCGSKEYFIDTQPNALLQSLDLKLLYLITSDIVGTNLDLYSLSNAFDFFPDQTTNSYETRYDKTRDRIRGFKLGQNATPKQF